MAGRIFLIFGCLAALSFYNGLASEPSPLQDFCVADANSGVFVNGRACKDASKVKAEDFFFQGLHLEGDTSNSLGSAPTLVSVANLAGLNTLGVSLLRLDFAPLGLVPPHLHPRASEVLTVIEGTIEVGFVTSNPGNRLITKVLNKGDVFVFPVGLIHYQRNVGKGKAISLSGLSSQNPGVVLVANTVFGSTPDIPADILAKAFQLDSNTILNLQSKFQPGK